MQDSSKKTARRAAASAKLVRQNVPLSRNSLFKDFIREISKSKARFFSIFFIVLLGVGFFAGIKATAPDMQYTADQYFDETNLFDIHVMSTLGLTDGDLEAIAQVPGVERVQGGYFTDVTAMIDGSTLAVFKVHSLPKAYKEDPDADVINKINLIEGRMPQASGECLVEESLQLVTGYQVGDIITVSSGTDTPITDDVLARDQFVVVGKFTTSNYMSYQRGTSEIGSGTVNFILYVPEEDFIYPVYTEALVTVEGAKELSTYSKEYKALVDNVQNEIENIGSDRSIIRADEIRALYEEALNDARQQLSDGQAQFDESFASAQKELDGGKEELDKGEAELGIQKDNFESQIKSALQEIQSNESTISEGYAAYHSAKSAYDTQMANSSDTLDEINEIVTSIVSLKKQAQSQMSQAQEKMNDTTLTETERSQWSALYYAYSSLLSITGDAVDSADNLNQMAQLMVTSTKETLAATKNELDSGAQQLEDGKKQLAESQVVYAAVFASSEQKIADGWAEYTQGKYQFDLQKSASEAELLAGQEELFKAEVELDRLSSPIWYVLDRETNIGYVDYRMSADRIDAISQIFPVFFFLVAALVCSTTMTRMVDEQRLVIGTYKALGFTNSDISFKFVAYAAIASLSGGTIGLFLGISFFPQAIFSSWQLMYMIPDLSMQFQPVLMVVSVVAGVLVTVASAYLVCRRDLEENPAMLMRPKAPKLGKAILLERWKGFWNKLSFSQKVTTRNLFRYKKRFWMTVIGITGCSALLIAGLGLNDSVKQVVSMQFKEIFKYTLQVSAEYGISEAEMGQIKEVLNRNPAVSDYGMASTYTVTFTPEDNSTSAMSVTMVVPANVEEFTDYVTIRDRSSGIEYLIPDYGVVISEKLATSLGVGVGDFVRISTSGGLVKRVEVSGITEQYVYHYCYMDPLVYTDIFRLAPDQNTLMVNMASDYTTAEANQLSMDLIDMDQVSSVVYYSTMAGEIEDSMSAMNGVIVLIIVCAAMLAFVVLYNLTNINISERLREIATIKVLGFFNGEVIVYVYRENLILSLVGALTGLGLGVVLHRVIMLAIEQDYIMFGYYINPLSFVYAVLITMFFSVLVGVVMYKKLHSIQMVESLKSIE